MTDDLLDEALTRANRYNHASNCPCDPDRDPYVGCACGETRREDLRRDVRALVERVQQAKAERDQLGNAAFAAYCAAGGDTDGADNWQEFFRPITSPPWSEVVEREVRQAIRDEEEEAETQAGIAAIRTAERDAARGKLDKVRQWSENNLGGAQNAALLAILDDKAGT